MKRERIFTADASAVVFGPGATREAGTRVRALGCRNVLVVTDPRVAELPPVTAAVTSLEGAGVAYELFADVRVEPTDASLRAAIEAAVAGAFDGFVSVGGGSAIDTAKVANLYSTWPEEFMAYVYPPLGQGKQPPGPLKPHVAIPTTAGTGSETTGNAVFDLASPIACCVRAWASSIPKTRGRCRQWSPLAPGSMCCVMHSSRTRRSRSTNGRR
jgi:hydroxyacid-oxoacid transhydrogenase